ncbi:MAG: hypothetical protein ACI35Z_16000 [Sphingobacterium hotanense]
MKALSNLSKFEIKEQNTVKGGKALPPGTFPLPGNPYLSFSISESSIFPGTFYYSLWDMDGQYVGGFVLQK